MESRSVEGVLNQLATLVAGDDKRKKVLTDWDRTIEWHVDNEIQLWEIRDTKLSRVDQSKVDMRLTTSSKTLEKLITGNLDLLTAISVTREIKYEGSLSDARRLGYVFLNDKRKKRVVFLAHCFLNINARFPGGADFEGANHFLVSKLMEKGLGIIQMPCPEMHCLGLLKQGYGIIPTYLMRRCFARIANDVVIQMEEFVKFGHDVVCVIGMNPSPSCGVEVTKGKQAMLGLDTDQSEKNGSGVFIEELTKLMTKHNLSKIPVVGIRRSMPNETDALERVEAFEEKWLSKISN